MFLLYNRVIFVYIQLGSHEDISKCRFKIETSEAYEGFNLYQQSLLEVRHTFKIKLEENIVRGLKTDSYGPEIKRRKKN